MGNNQETKEPLQYQELLTDDALESAQTFFGCVVNPQRDFDFNKSVADLYTKLQLDRLVVAECLNWYKLDNPARLAGLIAHNVRTLYKSAWAIPPSITSAVASRMAVLIRSALEAKNSGVVPPSIEGQCFGMPYAKVAF